MPGRNTNSSDYRYGYNGMEKDKEPKLEGNSYTTEFRQYDPRLGRWLSLDPLMAQFPWMSPYVGFDNNPIYFNDPLGLSATNEGGPPVTGEEYDGQISDDGNYSFSSVDNAWGLILGEVTVRPDACSLEYMEKVKTLDQELSNANVFTTDLNAHRALVHSEKYKAWAEWQCCLGHCPPPPMSFMEMIHSVLDAVGMIPVIGEPFDMVNAMIYSSEGDFINAAISTAAIIPILGSVPTGARLAKKAASGIIESTEKTAAKEVGEEMTRKQAQRAAKEHAQVPRNSKGGRDIGMDHLNETSRGSKWQQQKAGGAKRMGRENAHGKNKWEEHPDGHPGQTGPGHPAHHSKGHFHSVDKNGVQKVFPYK